MIGTGSGSIDVINNLRIGGSSKFPPKATKNSDEALSSTFPEIVIIIYNFNSVIHLHIYDIIYY